MKFWVPAATATVRGGAVNAAPLDKRVAPPGAIDEANRVAIGSANQNWRLAGHPGAVTVNHGGITKVTLHGRIYLSNNGASTWDFSVNQPFVAPYVIVDGTAHYFTPDARSDPGYWVWSGQAFDAQFNWYRYPGLQPVSFHIGPTNTGWDITSFAAWDNTKLAACEFGLSMDQQLIGGNSAYVSGQRPHPNAGANSPAYNVSQLILEVDATDPPPVYASGLVAVIA